MSGYNLPDFTGPNDPLAPWNEDEEDDDMEEEKERWQYEETEDERT